MSEQAEESGYGIFICPLCNHAEDGEAFDVLGADPDHVFCPNCNEHIKIPEIEQTEVEGTLFERA